MLSRIFATIMAASGVLTLAMVYAAISPVSAVQSMFQETPQGAMAAVVPNWGVLIGLSAISAARALLWLSTR